ncbi:hypothetical protein tb265_46860 [Gemmatimonadetes bacterium T265]|nr:hypothetical protein tb265_46860 [Gemmatimonadetes bacterium T265]
MTPERHRQMQAVFADAAERPATERVAFLDAACAGDAALRARVEALLAADAEVSDAEASGADAPDLLGAPLPVLAAMLVDEDTDGPIVPIGHTFGNYEVVRELGRGGMATVYLARDAKHDRSVALKTLYPDLAASLGPERFKREIRTAARLQHPHVLTLLDSGETDGRLWFTMPYVEGETLRARLRREGPLPFDDVVRTVREVALALEYAHAHGVVHRDIKPENVLLSAGTAVVADFGVAKAIAAAAGPVTGDAPPGRAGAPRTGLTAVGAALGTPAYMAPEQAIGDPGADARADLYSLGCLAYELLAGRPPFVADTPWRLVRAHIDRAPEPVARYRPDTPPALAALVMQCLEKHPATRPASAAAVVAALDALPAAQPATRSSAPPPAPRAPPARPRAWPLRWSRRTIAVFVVGLVMAGGVAAALQVPAQLRALLATLLTRPSAALNPRRAVVAPFDNRTGDSSLTVLGAMAADWVAQELMRTGEFEVVDPHTAATTGAVLARVPRALREDDPAVALAKETGAGRVVTGGIDRVGDDLRFQVQLVDVASGRLLRAVPAVSGSVRAPAAAVAALARRAVAELATTVDTAAGAGAAAVGRPPSYEAYREVSRAVESWFRSDRKDHDVRLARAAALDSTYALPLLLATWAAEDERRWADADSLMRRVARLDTLLTPTERDQRDVLAAGLTGDQRGELRAAEALLARSPGSAEVALVVAQSAVRINRPAAALAALDAADPARGLNLVSPWYWIYRGVALHELGRYEAELDAAGRGRRQFPQAPGVRLVAVRALAALGRVADVDRGLAEDPQLGAGGSYRLEARVLAAERELRAHGHAADAARVLDTALARLGLAGPGAAAAVRADSAQAADRGSASDGALYHAELLYDAGRWDDARQIVAARATDTTDLAGLGRLGTIAARTGDRAAAARVDARLAAARGPYLFGRAALWRARIAALLGNRPTAVALLERAVSEGESMALPDRGVRGANFHTDPDLAGLRGYAPFETLLAPR